MIHANVRALTTHGAQRDIPLPETRPLALTQNFFWVMVACLVVVQAVPLVIAWMASAILH
jgi:hypothetical protein